jgi:hypothetical protein
MQGSSRLMCTHADTSQASNTLLAQGHSRLGSNQSSRRKEAPRRNSTACRTRPDKPVESQWCSWKGPGTSLSRGRRLSWLSGAAHRALVVPRPPKCNRCRQERDDGRAARSAMGRQKKIEKESSLDRVPSQRRNFRSISTGGSPCTPLSYCARCRPTHSFSFGVRGAARRCLETSSLLQERVTPQRRPSRGGCWFKTRPLQCEQPAISAARWP